MKVVGNAIIKDVWKKRVPYGWQWNLVVASEDSGNIKISKIFPRDAQLTKKLQKSLIAGNTVSFTGKFNKNAEIVCTYFGRTKDDNFLIKILGDCEEVYSFAPDKNKIDISFKIVKSAYTINMFACSKKEEHIEAISKLLSNTKKLQLEGVFYDGSIYLKNLKAA